MRTSLAPEGAAARRPWPRRPHRRSHADSRAEERGSASARINPRLFPPPASSDNWASKATFGERVWIARGRVPIPARHRTAPRLLRAAAAIGALVAFGGAIAGLAWPTLAGGLVMHAGKLWFCDRMVWLHEDMKDADPLYASWLRRGAPWRSTP